MPFMRRQTSVFAIRRERVTISSRNTARFQFRGKFWSREESSDVKLFTSYSLASDRTNGIDHRRARGRGSVFSHPIKNRATPNIDAGEGGVPSFLGGEFEDADKFISASG